MARISLMGMLVQEAMVSAAAPSFFVSMAKQHRRMPAVAAFA